MREVFRYLRTRGNVLSVTPKSEGLGAGQGRAMKQSLSPRAARLSHKDSRRYVYHKEPRDRSRVTLTGHRGDPQPHVKSPWEGVSLPRSAPSVLYLDEK